MCGSTLGSKYLEFELQMPEGIWLTADPNCSPSCPAILALGFLYCIVLILADSSQLPPFVVCLVTPVDQPRLRFVIGTFSLLSSHEDQTLTAFFQALAAP